MAEKYEIDLELKSNFDKVVKNVDDLKKGMQGVQKETEDISKSAKNAEKGVKSIGDGFKAVGLSIKAMGIGLLLEAFAILKDVFSKNQVVADKFATAVGAVSKVFNDLVSFLIKNIPDVVNFFKDIFENPQKHIEKLGTLIKENLIERFDSLLKTAGYLGEALGKLFEGKFAAAVESVKKAGKESVDIFTGVNNSVDRAGKAVEDIGNAISKYGKETWNAAAAQVQLQNAAEIAAARQAGLVEKYDRAAEKQRQIRDNDLLSIQDRIKANNELKNVLDLQSEAMLKLANTQIQSAKANYEINKSKENLIALINAETNKKGVLAQIEGLISEQKSNEVSLGKELVAMKQSDIDATAQLALENKKFIASQKDNNLDRLNAEREILLAEQETERERLQLKIDNAAKGTQARVDAEIEYKRRMQEIGQEVSQNLKNTNVEILAQEKAAAEGKKAIQESYFQAVEGGIGLLKGLFEDNKDIQKGLLIAESAVGIARIITNTMAANAADAAAASLMGPYGLIYLPKKLALNKVNAGIGIATNIAATSKALSALGGGGAGGGGTIPSGQAGGGNAPQFNVVGATGVNQLAGAIAGKEQAPVQAYVVANNVTTAQSLDRNIIRSATLG